MTNSLAPRRIRCAVVTNVPAPYRLPMWDILAASGQVDLHVIYCAAAHIDPSQDGRNSNHGVHFLGGRYHAFDTRFTHADLGVCKVLAEIRPDVVITNGFIPTFVFAFAWAVLHRVPHVTMTDGTLETERTLSWKHRLIRRIVFAFTRSHLGACQGSVDLYRSYGIPAHRIHVSPLCTDNERFGALLPSFGERKYDFLFCGRYMDLKNPLMAIRIARSAAARLGRRVSLRFVGKGELEPAMRVLAAEVAVEVDVSFAGYLSQEALPREYAAARIFLFPTSMDCWGVVVNEACAAGVPCIVSPHTGVAGEMVRDGESGFVCPLDDEALWIERCHRLLADEAHWCHMSLAARRAVSGYTFEHAAKGVLQALQQAVASPLAKVRAA